MAIVSFWNGSKEQCGNSSSALLLATQIAIDNNIKVLLVSTAFNDKTFRECFWYEKKKPASGIFGPNTGRVERNGIEGLDRIIRSNKISPDIITDYTKIVLKGRLEVLLGVEGAELGTEYDNLKERYLQIITLANKYYDLVIVDMDKRLGKFQNDILRISNLTIAMLPQRVSEIQNVVDKIKKDDVIKEENLIYVIGKYMQDTKYNVKNITRSIFKRKEILNVIPYNNLFFEASQEGKVVDLFLNLMRIKDKDNNYKFSEEVKKLAIEIKKRAK